jgi:hypothetical protein
MGSTVVGDVEPSLEEVSTVSHSASTLFTGQTSFCQQDREALKNNPSVIL